MNNTDMMTDLGRQGFMRTCDKVRKQAERKAKAARTARIYKGVVTFNDGFSRDLEANELDELVTDLKSKGYKVTVN